MKLTPSLISFNVTIVVLLITLPLLFTGCWDRREIQFLNVVTGLGFDQIMVGDQPKIRLSILTQQPASLEETKGAGGAGGSSGKAGILGAGRVISFEGETISDALRQSGLRTSRQLFMSHTQVIIIGEELAKKGIAPVVDFATRHKDINLRTLVMVCEGTAFETLQSQPEIEGLTTSEIKGISKFLHRSSMAASANLFNVLYDLMTPGREPAVSYLRTITPLEESSPIKQPDNNTQNRANSVTEGRSEEGGVPPQHKTPVIEGSAIFSGNKMVGLLDPEESQGFLLITNQAGSGVIPVAYAATQKDTSYLFRNVKTQVNPVINYNGITFVVNLKGQGDFRESDTVIELNEENIRKLEELINQEVEYRCLKAVTKIQAIGADALGFGDILYRLNPKVWKDIKDQWDEIFPTVRVQVQADFQIKHTGLVEDIITIN
ncbi:MAG: Ger(x)C family spore germination protein [Syntrophomonadaceae bacterium]|nr:Ger(x)C family spore germination protein [Syntrophomonadaceae bacterium]